MSRPLLLDLFCGAGGAAMGYHRAGFDVVGVDIKPQPHYPFEFVQANALPAPVTFERFDAIHASPPCQPFSSLRGMWNAGKHPDLIEATRELLFHAGKPSVMENVPGAPLENAVRLCGSSFALGVEDGSAELRRHRMFELSFSILVPPCAHGTRTIGVYGHQQRKRVIGVYGGHGRDRRRTSSAWAQDFPTEDRRFAMGIDWMTGDELSQAIPPAYTEFIGAQLLEHLNRTEGAAS